MPDQDAAGSAALDPRYEDGALVLRLSGELDLTNIERIRASIDAVLARPRNAAAFDLSRLKFMDSSGIALLLSVTRQVGGNVELRDPSPIIRRLIELTGLESVLRLVP
jgi:anti-anti-sigma factor